jgi:hypothetical protein
MEPNATTEILKVASGFGLVGTVAVILGFKFLKDGNKREERAQQIADEDRKWIRDVGEKQMVLMASMVDTIKTAGDTMKAVSETNTKLVVILESKK